MRPGCFSADHSPGMTTERTSEPPPRLQSIDLLRGLAMIVMLLDHTRDFVHREGLTGDAMDPTTTTPALYFTRWITHFCAPTFVLLAGLASRLQLARGTTRPELSSYLLQRGLFLVALELVVLRPLIWFQLDYSLLAQLQVIWAIGWSMCGLALLVRLRVPDAWIGAIGVLVLATHNLIPHTPFDWTQFPSWKALWMILFVRGGLQFGGDQGPVAFVQYPVLPWFAVMLCGFWIATRFSLPPELRRRWLGRAGAATAGLFVLLRALTTYGDPSPWTAQPSLLANVYMFLRVEKYPPSLHFALMTLGAALLALAAFDRHQANPLSRVVITVGRVPLFFYVLQWPAVHLVSRLFQWLAGQPIGWESPNPLTLTALPPNCGFSLPTVYLAFILGLLVLVPLSLAFARWKQQNPHRAWLHYF